MIEIRAIQEEKKEFKEKDNKETPDYAYESYKETAIKRIRKLLNYLYLEINGHKDFQQMKQCALELALQADIINTLDKTACNKLNKPKE